MSRIGRLPISLPKGVTCTFLEADHLVTVKGTKGELKQNISPEELARKMNVLYNKLDGSIYYSLAKSYLKQIGYADLREDDFITKTYYILRHIAHYRANGLSSDLFASCFTQCLDLRKIPYELIVTAPSTLTEALETLWTTALTSLPTAQTSEGLK